MCNWDPFFFSSSLDILHSKATLFQPSLTASFHCTLPQPCAIKAAHLRGNSIWFLFLPQEKWVLYFSYIPANRHPQGSVKEQICSFMKANSHMNWKERSFYLGMVPQPELPVCLVIQTDFVQFWHGFAFLMDTAKLARAHHNAFLVCAILMPCSVAVCMASALSFWYILECHCDDVSDVCSCGGQRLFPRSATSCRDSLIKAPHHITASPACSWTPAHFHSKWALWKHYTTFCFLLRWPQ